jgi:hypothetical protein
VILTIAFSFHCKEGVFRSFSWGTDDVRSRLDRGELIEVLDWKDLKQRRCDLHYRADSSSHCVLIRQEDIQNR